MLDIPDSILWHLITHNLAISKYTPLTKNK